MKVSPRSRAARVCALALAVSALGCSESLSPLDVAGVYALASRDGASLPLLMHAGEATDIFLMSETLVIRADGSGSTTWVQEHRGVGGNTETVTSERDISYKIVDERIEIEWICGPLENCTPPPHLVLYRTSRGLESIAAPGSQPMLSYVRIQLIGL